MTAGFYQEVFFRQKMRVATPENSDQQVFNKICLNDLIQDVVEPSSKKPLLTWVRRLREQYPIDGLVLGDTKLSLCIRRDNIVPLPLLDTLTLRVEAALRKITTGIPVESER